MTELFDSILRGYPIGALLFWQRSLPAETTVLGGLQIEAPPVDEGWMIVDGQQRTAALASALSERPLGADPRWEVRYVPAERCFKSGLPAPSDAGREVPLSVLGDLKRLGRWLRENDLDKALENHLEDVQQRILDYELPAYVVATDDMDALRGVFARLNSTGVRMQAHEVFQALAAGPSKRRLDLGALQRAADVDGFGEPPLAEIHKAVLAMSGANPLLRLDRQPSTLHEQLIDPTEAEEALRRCVEFLTAPFDRPEEPGAGIPAYVFLPYPVVFVLLARWFHLFPEPDHATRVTLARWVWRGVASGLHQRANVSAMGHQRAAMRPDHESKSLKALMDAVNDVALPAWSLKPFFARSAGSRVELLALLSLGPRSPLGPVSWRALVSDGARVARELFRPQLLDAEGKSLGRTAANRVLLDARHTGLSAELHTWDWSTHRNELETHLIDEAAFRLLRTQNSEARTQFLTGRARRIAILTQRFLEHRVGAEQPRLLPVSAYVSPVPAEVDP